MEKLLACSLICSVMSAYDEQYSEHLHELFLSEPNSGILLELETITDINESFIRLKRYFDYETDIFDEDQFGRILFRELGRIYHSNVMRMEDFTAKCYEIYLLLPSHIDKLEQTTPFFTLCYLDDMLCCNRMSEIQNRIEEMITFYE